MAFKGFGNCFLTWINLIYMENYAKLTMGRLEPMQLKKQSWMPFISLLFDLVIQTLAIKVQLHPEIRCFKIKMSESKLSLYTDDVVILHKPFHSLSYLFDLIQGCQDRRGASTKDWGPVVRRGSDLSSLLLGHVCTCPSAHCQARAGRLSCSSVAQASLTAELACSVAHSVHPQPQRAMRGAGEAGAPPCQGDGAGAHS